MIDEKDAIGLVGFVLVIGGTLGLLLNEFVFGWGRAATLTFAAANILGLIAIWGVLKRRMEGSNDV